jgi:hypothetical protein
MVSRVPLRHSHLRDVSRLSVLFVWVAFAASVLFYFGEWPLVPHSAAAKGKSQNLSGINNADIFYTGSIVLVPESGERCSVLGLDNRTGRIWDKGFVNCYDVVAQSAARKKFEGMSGERLHAIARTFHTVTD